MMSAGLLPWVADSVEEGRVKSCLEHQHHSWLSLHCAQWCGPPLLPSPNKWQCGEFQCGLSNHRAHEISGSGPCEGLEGLMSSPAARRRKHYPGIALRLFEEAPDRPF